MSRVLEVIPTIMTDNLYNTLSAYKNILNEINFNNLIINDNGTIEYEGDIFTELKKPLMKLSKKLILKEKSKSNLY